MVEERLILEPEVEEILGVINRGKNFLLSGGAGSGKTYSLVQVVRQALKLQPKSKVACITYTNAAVQEIEDRVKHSNLKVSTIHDFLWDLIKHFQNELKDSLVSLVNDPNIQVSVPGTDEVPRDFFKDEKIEYKEFLKLSEGIISHDHVILLAHRMFEKYPKLSDILKDKFQFLFIDEYQDTNPMVIEIFLTHLKSSPKEIILGFFGDSMQSIYDDSIGSLDGYQNEVVQIKKEQNRRNPRKIIDLANKLRTDNIVQIPSVDLEAPNMDSGTLKEGEVLFIHSKNPDVSAAKSFLTDSHGWNFEQENTKELNLTHNLIAEKAGFPNLIGIYDGDGIIKYRNRIKKYIKDRSITEDFSGKTFQEIIGILSAGKSGSELQAILPTPMMKRYLEENPELYEKALRYPFLQFSKLYFDKDQLIDDKKQNVTDESKKGSKRCRLIRHLYRIEKIIDLYNNGRFNEFLKLTDYRHRIFRIADKHELKANIEELVQVGNKTIGTVIKEAHDKGIVLVDDSLIEFQQNRAYLYERVADVPYHEFQNLYKYLEGKTPFSTQHKTKGAEFDNVLVILDNGRWNKYNFKNLLLNAGSQSVLDRTKKIFYVCCTRSKEKLAVFFHNPGDDVIEKATDLFGTENIISLD